MKRSIIQKEDLGLRMFGDNIWEERLDLRKSNTENCIMTYNFHSSPNIDRLCGLVVRVLGYRSGGPGSIPGTTRFSEGEKKRKQVVGLERGPLSLMSTTAELLDRKVAAPV
jgi:hypothetical protein